MSAVIPTHRRPELVRRAIESVRAQTFTELEIIVVSDGASAETSQAVRSISDSRIRYFENVEARGVSATRNLGVRMSRGPWIALLDDDDSWEAGKLEAQLRAAAAERDDAIVVSGIVRYVHPDGGTEIKPNRFPAEGESTSDYIFDLRGLWKKGHIHTSTILARKWLFDAVPFNEALNDHEDFQWLIEASSRHKARPVVVPEIVASCSLGTGGLSRPGGFQSSKKWFESAASMLSARAKGGILATFLSGKAACDREVRSLPWLCVQLIRNVPFAPAHVANLLAPWVLGTRLRNALKKFSLRESAVLGMTARKKRGGRPPGFQCD